MWNGINYLLKMPSDLNFLSEYLAIKRWAAGFSFIRNPFCVPRPMEESLNELSTGFFFIIIYLFYYLYLRFAV
jgi:hypothetical protein